MALARAWSIALVGIEGHVVEVQADLAQGIPGLGITGLPDTSLSEARDRVKAAVLNSGFGWPQKRITLGLSPAALPKRGSHFDLALAAALLAAAEELPAGALRDVLLLGELGLDGKVRPVPGVLPAAAAGKDKGYRRVVVPVANLAEARLLEAVDAVAVASLRELVDLLTGEEVPDRSHVVAPEPEPPVVADYLDVAGQPAGRLACEVVAAGGHNLLMTGPPGCGKTLLAERLPGILPPLSLEESLQVTSIHSVAGVLPAEQPLVALPPFQAPHHGATSVSVVGGGSGIARPGAASLAHRGVLFLDEAPEFSRGVLDALRQPLESGHITIRRVGGTATYPARFSLVLAANPCPCAQPAARCTCPSTQRRTYLARLSGPLLDRVDVQVRLQPLTRAEIMADRELGESSAVLAARVRGARERAARRFAGTPWRTNGDVPTAELTRSWPLDRSAMRVLGDALDRGMLTARGFGRVQRLAWTLADLADRDRPTADDANAALGLRLGDTWGGSVAA